VSALEGAEALLERVSLSTHARIRHTGAVVGSEGAGRVGAVHGGIAANAGALAKRAQPHVGGPRDTAMWVSDQQAQLVP
jgi:hypothetical protein